MGEQHFDVEGLVDWDGSSFTYDDVLAGKVDLLCVRPRPLRPSLPEEPPKSVRKKRRPTAKADSAPRESAVGKAFAKRAECVFEFKQLLERRGYSAGSWNHARGCNGNCGRTCAGTLRRDGSVHKYPQSMKLLFDAGIVHTRFDLFKPETSARAKQFYEDAALSSAKRSKKWSSLDADKRSALVLKMYRNLAHGLDDFVKLAPQFRPGVGCPLSPSLEVRGNES